MNRSVDFFEQQRHSLCPGTEIKRFPRLLPALISLLLLAAMDMRDMRAEAKAYSDVEFSRPGGYSLKFDAHVPDGEGPFPAVIIVHGGAWVTGDRRRSVEPLFEPLSDAGFAWFSISYRLANVADPKSTPTIAASMALLGGAIDDVRAAVAYVRTHASEYNVDPQRIALLGESAGAQLAAMAALKPSRGSAIRPGSGQGAAVQAAAVQAVIAFYCPSDLVTLVQTMPLIPDSVRNAIKGTPFEGILLAYLRELSPMTWVRQDAPPFLLIHGTADQVVPFQQSLDFCDAIQKAGSACDLYTMNGVGHGLRGWESAKQATAYKARVTHWLTQQFAPSRDRN
jgi:acetyl esterase